VSRSRLAIWNYLSVMLFTGVTLLGLFVTKYVRAWLGLERFGAVGMVTNWLGYLNIFEIGLSSTLAPLLARVVAMGDKERLESTVAAGIRIFGWLLGLCLLISAGFLAIITWFIPVSQGVKFDLRLAWCMGMIGLVPMVLSPFRALADARQYGYRINLALTAQSVMIFSLSFAFAYLGFGITGQVAATTLATIPLALFLTRDGLKAYPDLLRAARESRPAPEVWKSIQHLGSATTLLAFSGRMSVLTDNLVVGKILEDAGVAGSFQLTLKLTTLAQSQLQGIGNACWAALAELHTQDRRDDFNRRLIELTGLVSLLGIAGLGPIVAYSHHFVVLFFSAADYLGDRLVLMSALNAFLLGLISLWFWCFSGTGRVREMLPMTLLSTAINVAASIGFTFAFGAIGPLLGTTLGFFSTSLWYIPLKLRRAFGTPIGPLFLSAARPLALGLPYAMALYSFAASHEPRGLLGLALEMGVSALAFLAISFRLVLSPTDRAAWSMRFRSAIRRNA
jgi:O-antigen/teichoic acid export membrane protein